jgi:hypothetical protein
LKFFKTIVFMTATLLPAFVYAQSGDQNLPTAVLSNEINGTIPALDLGDSRLTRRYFAFESTPGDLVVTVNSRNLNGDVDIFTAVTFRPLTKISIYAGTIPPEVTKSLYFRTRQILILRIEARTPNDDAGTYRITFGGSFQPFSGGIPVAENTAEESDAEKARGDAERLSSVGATLPKPPGEIVEKPTETVEEKPVTPEPTARRNTRNPPRRASRRPPARTTRTPAPKPDTAKTETAPARTEEPAKTEEPKPTVTEEKKAAEAPVTLKPSIKEGAGARLVIEQTDGTRIDRPMSTIRRVIVETNAIVIVLRTGKMERFATSTVARMTIEPE